MPNTKRTRAMRASLDNMVWLMSKDETVSMIWALMEDRAWLKSKLEELMSAVERETKRQTPTG